MRNGDDQYGLAVLFELVDLAEDEGLVDAREARVVRLPHRHRRSPEAVPGDRPVAGVLQPLAEDAVLDVVRRPGDLLVEREHALRLDEQPLAGAGQAEPLALALEQGRLEGILQALDLLAHGRLGEVEKVRSRRHAGRLGDRDEGPQERRVDVPGHLRLHNRRLFYT